MVYNTLYNIINVSYFFYIMYIVPDDIATACVYIYYLAIFVYIISLYLPALYSDGVITAMSTIRFFSKY